MSSNSRSLACTASAANCARVNTTGLRVSTCLIQRHAIARATGRPHGNLPGILRQPKPFTSRLHSRQTCAGLLDFFVPAKKTSRPAKLVTDILRIASSTDGGVKASPEQHNEIHELAEQLQQAGGVNDPVYSNLAWGEYEVTYSSLPRAAGGPILRSSPGQLLFAQQQLRQTLTPPETLVNIVNFKSLGLFPGQAIQPATIQTLTGTTYKITLKPASLYGLKLGPESTERTFEVLYLDETVRIVKFLPNESSTNPKTVLFVLRRLSKADEDMQEHADDDHARNIFSTLADNMRNLVTRPKSAAGLATQAERRFSQQRQSSR